MQRPAFIEAFVTLGTLTLLVGGAICLARVGGADWHDAVVMLVGAAAGFAGAQSRHTMSLSTTMTAPPHQLPDKH